MNRANSGFDAIVAVSRLVKGSCLDTLSALDMSTFGFTPGASALVTKLASQACQRLTSELSQKVNDVNSKISQGINDVEGRVNNGIGDVTGGMLGSSGGFGPDTSIGPGGSTSPLGVVKDAVGNAWDKMKNLLTR